MKDGLSLSSATFTTIKITTVWLDNNPNAVTSTVVKGETQLDTSEKCHSFFFFLDSKGYWTGIYSILHTHTRTQASTIKAHICPCMLELSSKSNLTLSFYCRDVFRPKHFLEAFSVSTSCIKETEHWWRINNKWDRDTPWEFTSRLYSSSARHDQWSHRMLLGCTTIWNKTPIVPCLWNMTFFVLCRPVNCRQICKRRWFNQETNCDDGPQSL